MAKTITKKDLAALIKIVGKAKAEAVNEWFDELAAAKATKGKKKKVVDEALLEAVGPAPKRPISAYLAYASANRASIKAKNPDAGFAEITTIIANEWNKIKEDKKKSKKYHDEAAKAKATFDKEKKAYDKKVAAYKAGEGSGDEESGDASEEEKPKPKAKGKGKAAPKGKAKKTAKEESEEEEVEEEAEAASEEEKPKAKGKAKKAAKEESEEEAPEEEDAEVDYSKMKLPELKKLAKEHGVDIKGKTKKDDIVAALEAAGGEAEEKTEEEEVEEEEEEVEEDEE